MFGYVIPDKPNMFMKDYTLYRAFYCGLCKSIGKHQGQFMRFTTNYDMTFLNVLYHSILDADIKINNEVCILNPLKKKPIVVDDELTQKIIKINTLLAHYKCVDDIIDNNSKTKKFIADYILKKHVKRAARSFPKINLILSENYEVLRMLESDLCADADKISSPFATIMKEITKELFQDKYTEELGDMMYYIGKWVYLVDAIDDIEEDEEKNKYNVFLVNYYFKDRATFICEKKEYLEKLLKNCYNKIVENFDKIKTTKYEGVLTNILWYGILYNTNEMLGRKEKCKKIRI